MSTLNERLTTIRSGNVDGPRSADGARGGIEKLYSDPAFYFACEVDDRRDPPTTGWRHGARTSRPPNRPTAATISGSVRSLSRSGTR